MSDRELLTAITLPSWSPLFPSDIIRFEDCTRVIMLGRLPEGVSEKIVPYPLKPVSDYIFISWLKMGAVLGLPSRNNISLSVPVSYDGDIGKYCTLEYTSTGFGLAAGRELGGWPKKDGNFEWTETAQGVDIELRRYGNVLARAKAKFQQPATHMTSWPEEFEVPDCSGCNLQVRHLARSADAAPQVAEVMKTVYPNFELTLSKVIDVEFSFFDGPIDKFGTLGEIEILAARYEKSEFDFSVPQSVGFHDL